MPASSLCCAFDARRSAGRIVADEHHREPGASAARTAAASPPRRDAVAQPGGQRLAVDDPRPAHRSTPLRASRGSRSSRAASPSAFRASPAMLMVLRRSAAPATTASAAFGSRHSRRAGRQRRVRPAGLRPPRHRDLARAAVAVLLQSFDPRRRARRHPHAHAHSVRRFGERQTSRARRLSTCLRHRAGPAPAAGTAAAGSAPAARGRCRPGRQHAPDRPQRRLGHPLQEVAHQVDEAVAGIDDIEGDQPAQDGAGDRSQM